MENVRYILTGLSFFICGILFIFNAKKNFEKKKSKSILGIVLIILGVACFIFLFIPEDNVWEEISESHYVVKKENIIINIATLPENECAADSIFFYKEGLEKKGYLISEKQNFNTDDIMKYIISFSRQKKYNGHIAIYTVTDSLNTTHLRLYQCRVNNGLIEFHDTYLEGEKINYSKGK